MILTLFLITSFGVLLVQGYKEEIFSRLEISGFENVSDISKWLAGPKRKASSYRNFAVEMQEVFAIRQQVESATEFEELTELKKDANRIDSSFGRYRTDLIKEIDTRQKTLGEELARISEERREQRLSEEKAQRDLDRIISRIENARDETTLDRLDRQLANLDVDTSEAESLLESQRESIRISEELVNPDF